MSDKLKKLVVITGASSGFGEHLAKLLSNEGYPLLLVARRLEKMEAFKLNNCLCKKVDVSNYEEFERACKEAEQHFNTKIDLMVNNAGVMLLGNIWEQDPKDWDEMINCNVKGVLHGCRIVLKDMMERNSGTIINVSSIAGHQPFDIHSVYGATKYSVTCITDTVRMEVAKSNVRVLQISPGIGETELLSHNIKSKDVYNAYLGWKKDLEGQSMDPSQVALTMKFMYQLPQAVSLRDIIITPTKQT